MPHRLSVAFVACLVLAGTLRLGTAAPPSEPALVLQGATIVVGNGQTIPAATVVVRNGLIEAVGPKAAIPAGARVVNVEGMLIYPGLIDALTEQGLVKRKPPLIPEAEQNTDNQALFAEVRAADLIDAAARELPLWREAGVLTLNVAPDRGIFMGQTALVNLNGGPADGMVVRPSVAMRTAFQGLGYRNRRRGQGEPGGVYPTRLIGVQAFIRQTLLDAHYYDDRLRASTANPAILARPDTNRTLEALLPVARRTMPLIIPGQEQRDIQRIVDIADETKVSVIIAGGNEAGDMAKALNDRRIPVLVSLTFPGPDTDVVPDFVVPVRVQRLREHARISAAELARAGIRFAFYSDGLTTGREYLGNLRLAVKAGLPREAAIRGATLSAAEVLGVDQRLGTVEAGKIANLVVADGDLLDDGVQIKSVVVDGRLFAVTTPGKAASRTTAPSAPAAAPVPPPHIGTAGTPPREVLITNATVMTVTHGTLTNASVLVRDGKIVAVGGNPTAGPQALVIDATGKWITPGLIDAHVHYPTDSHNEATSNVTSQTRMRDNLDPTSISMWWALSGGVTTIAVLHGSVNPIGGQPAVIKLRWGKTAPELLFQGARPTQKMALKDFVTRAGFSPPTSIMGCEAVIRDTLRRAQRYGREWDDYEKARAAGAAPLVPPRRDLALDPLVEILKGQRLVRAHVENDDERGMLMLMKVAEDFGFRIKTFEHAASAYRVADELARHGASASIFGSFTWVETSYNAAILKSRGVISSIHSDGEMATRYLNQEAAFVMTHGALTENDALALVTLNPAKQLEIDKWVGSIDVGKDADLAIWTKHPLSVYAVADTVLVDGQINYSLEREAQRLAWVETERKRLEPAAVAPVQERKPAVEAAGRIQTEVRHDR